MTASAPGKVVLCGEYAVLGGAPAISMAVDRRANVSLRKAEAASVTSVGVLDGSDTQLLDCVCDTLGIGRPVAELVLDTRGFFDPASATKLGIGSSAALTVALVRALCEPDPVVTDIFEFALLAHRKFQRGAGSGVDIATSMAGGLVEYKIGSTPIPIAWPDGLYYRLLWSGVAASTTARLDSLAHGEVRTSADALMHASVLIAERWHQGDAAALIDEYTRYIVALEDFDADHNLGIYDAGHDVLSAYKGPTNTVYKPCGAGGGDIGVVLGTDPDAVRDFAQYAAANGFRRLDMAIDPLGVRKHGVTT